MNLDWLHSSSTFLAIGVIHPRLLDITIMNEINALVTQLLKTSTVLQLSKQINLFERQEKHLIYVESMYRKFHFFVYFILNLYVWITDIHYIILLLESSQKANKSPNKFDFKILLARIYVFMWSASDLNVKRRS